MDSETLVDQIVRSLSFEVLAVPQSIKAVNSTSKSTPLNVKIKVRKRQGTGLLNGVLSMPVVDTNVNPQKDEIPERIRLVSSDQTIMNFNMAMEANFDKIIPVQNHVQKLSIISPGLETSNEERNPPLSKLHRSPLFRKRNKDIFGRCKPGGCLDPPYGEDKYAYQPANCETTVKQYPVQPAKQDSIKHTQLRSSSIFKNYVFNKKRKDSLNSSQVSNDYPTNKNEPDMSFNEISTHQISSQYSDSIITYPHISDSTHFCKEKKLSREESSSRSKQYNDDRSKTSSIEDGSYFVVHKKSKNLSNQSDAYKIQRISMKRSEINSDRLDSKINQNDKDCLQNLPETSQHAKNEDNTKISSEADVITPFLLNSSNPNYANFNTKENISLDKSAIRLSFHSHESKRDNYQPKGDHIVKKESLASETALITKKNIIGTVRKENQLQILQSVSSAQNILVEIRKTDSTSDELPILQTTVKNKPDNSQNQLLTANNENIITKNDSNDITGNRNSLGEHIKTRESSINSALVAPLAISNITTNLVKEPIVHQQIQPIQQESDIIISDQFSSDSVTQFWENNTEPLKSTKNVMLSETIQVVRRNVPDISDKIIKNKSYFEYDHKIDSENRYVTNFNNVEEYIDSESSDIKNPKNCNNLQEYIITNNDKQRNHSDTYISKDKKNSFTERHNIMLDHLENITSNEQNLDGMSIDKLLAKDRNSIRNFKEQTKNDIDPKKLYEDLKSPGNNKTSTTADINTISEISKEKNSFLTQIEVSKGVKELYDNCKKSSLGSDKKIRTDIEGHEKVSESLVDLNFVRQEHALNKIKKIVGQDKLSVNDEDINTVKDTKGIETNNKLSESLKKLDSGNDKINVNLSKLNNFDELSTTLININADKNQTETAAANKELSKHVIISTHTNNSEMLSKSHSIANAVVGLTKDANRHEDVSGNVNNLDLVSDKNFFDNIDVNKLSDKQKNLNSVLELTKNELNHETDSENCKALNSASRNSSIDKTNVLSTADFYNDDTRWLDQEKEKPSVVLVEQDDVTNKNNVKKMQSLSNLSLFGSQPLLYKTAEKETDNECLNTFPGTIEQTTELLENEHNETIINHTSPKLKNIDNISHIAIQSDQLFSSDRPEKLSTASDFSQTASVLRKSIDLWKIDIALQSYTNANNERVIKSFDSEHTPRRQLNDAFLVARCSLGSQLNEIKIPIDKLNDLSIKMINATHREELSSNTLTDNLKDHGEVSDFYDKKEINMEILRSGSKAEENIIYEIANKSELNKNNKEIMSDDIRNALNTLYEEELVPLQDIIKGLRLDIDALTYQNKIKERVLKPIPKRSRSIRLINPNKRCACFKRY